MTDQPKTYTKGDIEAAFDAAVKQIGHDKSKHADKAIELAGVYTSGLVFLLQQEKKSHLSATDICEALYEQYKAEENALTLGEVDAAHQRESNIAIKQLNIALDLSAQYQEYTRSQGKNAASTDLP